MTVDELVVIIRAETAGLQKNINSVQGQLTGMQRQTAGAQSKMTSAFSGMKKAIAAAGIALAVKKIATEIAGLTKEAMSVDAQIANLDRTMGASKSAYMEWAKNTAASFGISETAAVKYGNAYSNLISGFISDTATSTAYTKQMVEASAVIASRTGRTVEDVNDRIRSGLLGSTEAIEDLGINVNVALLETTDAFKQLANGRSWEKLTFQEQQQVRLFAIMEQSAKKFGTTLAGGGATSLMTMNAQLENLKLELGRAFTPLAETVIPIITDFVKVLADGVKWINQFFAALRGDTADTAENVQQSASGAEATASGLNSATEAAKKLKKVTAGFDEMTIVSAGQAVSSGGGAASGGLNLPAGAVGDFKEPDTSGISRAADKVKEILGGVTTYITETFSPSIGAWGGAFESLKEPVSTAFESVSARTGELWNETLLPFGGYIAEEYVPTITNAFSETFAPIFAETMPVLLEEFTKDFDFACGEIDRMTNDILQPSFDHAKTVAVDVFDGIKKAWDEHGTDILDGFQRFRDSLKEIWDTVYTNVIKPIFDRISGTVSWLWEQHLKPLWDNITDFFGSVVDCLLTLWNNVLAPIVDFVVTVVGPVVSAVVGSIGDVIGTVIGIVSDVIGGIIKALGGLLDFITGVFSGDWEKAWNGIKDFFGGIWDAIWGVAKGVINLIIDGINLLWGAVYGVASGIVNGIGEIAGAIGDIFGKDWHFEMPAEPPLIPKLATGGIVDRATTAVIGEAGREAVLPLENNTGWMDTLAGKLADMVNGRQPSKLILQVGETVMGEIALNSLNALSRQRGGLDLVMGVV